MEKQIHTIPIPPPLYEKVQKAEIAGLITDFPKFVHQLINERLDQLFAEDWRAGLRELQDSVAQTSPPMTKEEILEQMRRTREEVWEEEYADYYR